MSSKQKVICSICGRKIDTQAENEPCSYWILTEYRKPVCWECYDPIRSNEIEEMILDKVKKDEN